MLPFIWNSDVSDASHVSFSEHRCKDARCVFVFCCYSPISINIQGGCSNVLRQIKTESQWKNSNPQILAYCQLL